MSWDLRVATTRQPTRALIGEWAAGQGLAHRANCIEDAGGEALFTIDGPYAVESDDLDQPLTAAVRDAAWSLLISASLGDDADRTQDLACELATFLAERCGGAVFDPQTDGLLWPDGAAAAAPSERVVTSVVELVWYTTKDRGRAAGAAFVQAAAQAFPPATPRRYGTFEPPQSRYDPSQPGRFGADWRDCDSSMLLWTASPPCLGGTVMFPRTPNIAGAQPVVRVGVDVDGRALADPAVREGVVTLFADVAAALRAFYSAGIVYRGAIVERNKLWLSDETEVVDLPYTQWVGLPATPTWLTWYGEPYAALVTPGLVRSSVEPADADALRSTYQTPPPALVGSTDARRAAATMPKLA